MFGSKMTIFAGCDGHVATFSTAHPHMSRCQCMHPHPRRRTATAAVLSYMRRSCQAEKYLTGEGATAPTRQQWTLPVHSFRLRPSSQTRSSSSSSSSLGGSTLSRNPQWGELPQQGGWVTGRARDWGRVRRSLLTRRSLVRSRSSCTHTGRIRPSRRAPLAPPRPPSCLQRRHRATRALCGAAPACPSSPGRRRP